MAEHIKPSLTLIVTPLVFTRLKPFYSISKKKSSKVFMRISRVFENNQNGDDLEKVQIKPETFSAENNVFQPP